MHGEQLTLFEQPNGRRRLLQNLPLRPAEIMTLNALADIAGERGNPAEITPNYGDDLIGEIADRIGRKSRTVRTRLAICAAYGVLSIDTPINGATATYKIDVGICFDPPPPAADLYPNRTDRSGRRRRSPAANQQTLEPMQTVATEPMQTVATEPMQTVATEPMQTVATETGEPLQSNLCKPMQTVATLMSKERSLSHDTHELSTFSQQKTGGSFQGYAVTATDLATLEAILAKIWPKAQRGFHLTDTEPNRLHVVACCYKVRAKIKAGKGKPGLLFHMLRNRVWTQDSTTKHSPPSEEIYDQARADLKHWDRRRHVPTTTPAAAMLASSATVEAPRQRSIAEQSELLAAMERKK